jgi:hypothetical protein
MSDDYLWDGSGEPDPEVERLENLLARYRSQLSQRSEQPWGWFRERKVSIRWRLAAMAAGLVLVAAGIWKVRQPAISEWTIGSTAVAVGQTVRTGSSPATLNASNIGRLELEPSSALRVLRAGTGKQLVELQRGSMRAFIWAPPAQFAAETRSAKAIDLGCAYRLSVQPDGSGLITVDLGWVAFQKGAIESFIPAGAACRTRMHAGPGLPYFQAASPSFRAAVKLFDESGGREGVSPILIQARREDALTVWHLLGRTAGADRSAVAERLRELVPGVDRRSLESPEGVDAAWNKLGLGETSWWRKWEQEWAGSR